MQLCRFPTHSRWRSSTSPLVQPAIATTGRRHGSACNQFDTTKHTYLRGDLGQSARGVRPLEQCPAVSQAFLDSLPADDSLDFGALNQDGIDWFNEWYPVAVTRDLDKSRPHRFVLLDIPLVLWWDPNAAAWRAFEDICPHRLVPLSEGRINEAGQLECGYHGWAFSSHGRCEVVPQQGKRESPRACAVAYHAAERQGLLFVLPKPLPPALIPSGGPNDDLTAALAEAVAEEARIPVIPELDGPDGSKWLAQDTWRDLPYDWSTLMENVLDASHVPFTHHATLSNRKSVGDYDIRLTSQVTNKGFEGNWKTGPRAGKLGSQSTTFTAPIFMCNRLNGKGFKSMLVVYAVPMRPGRCRLINRNLLLFNNPIPETIIKLLPRWWGHLSAHVLLEDDQVFLHLGEEEMARRRAAGLSHSQVCYMPSKADTYIVAFHRWIQKFGGGGPFGGTDAGFVEALGARLGRKQLLDRYTQHTENCTSCQQGLKQVAAVRAAATAVQVAAGALALFCAAVAVSAASGGSAAAAAVTAAAATAAAASPPPAGLDTVAAAVGSALTKVAAALAGPHDPTGGAHMLRAAGWAAVAAAAALAGQKLESLRQLFFEGVYPPLRNVKKD